MYLLNLAAIILLPTFPAYLLFKALPLSTAEIKGPFKGFELKLGGAFAGYFALVVLVLYTIPPPPKAEVWQVDGQIVDPRGNPIEPLEASDVSVAPPWVRFYPDGAFRMFFSPVPTLNGLDYPELVIQHTQHGRVTIPLDPDRKDSVPHDISITRDPGKRVINLHRIALAPQAVGAYSGNGPAPTPISANQEPKP
ncbi:MAG TPA: hypothetical protein VFU86_14995 [Terriglobales bacterium]|nr:hypothetical protein [Terriglobales bacterium]